MSVPLSPAPPPPPPRRRAPRLSFACMIWGGIGFFIAVAILMMLAGR